MLPYFGISTNSRTTREDLYSELSESEDEPYVAPMGMEFVEVDAGETGEAGDNGDNVDEGEEEEFAFPLFSGAGPEKVTLDESDHEEISNERPEDYYRAVYTEKQRSEFAEAAVGPEILGIWQNEPVQDNWPWKVISLAEHNLKFEGKKKSRPGKRKRENRAICRERRLQREKKAKKAQKTRRFPGKPKQKRSAPVQKPKYRTE